MFSVTINEGRKENVRLRIEENIGKKLNWRRRRWNKYCEFSFSVTDINVRDGPALYRILDFIFFYFYVMQKLRFKFFLYSFYFHINFEFFTFFTVINQESTIIFMTLICIKKLWKFTYVFTLNCKRLKWDGSKE